MVQMSFGSSVNVAVDDFTSPPGTGEEEDHKTTTNFSEDVERERNASDSTFAITFRSWNITFFLFRTGLSGLSLDESLCNFM